MTSLNTDEERFVMLQKATEIPKNTQHKIQKVTNYFRNRKDFTRYYIPKMVSIGPIHHGDENLRVGEHYKLKWTVKYIDTTNHTRQLLHQKIGDNIVELKNLFAEDVLSRFEEKELTWMLFVDGCALLYILKHAKLHETGPEDMDVKVDQLVLVMTDVLLLENQLPYLVLKMLWNDSEDKLMETMKNFLKCHHWADNSHQKQHLRDLFRKHEKHLVNKNEVGKDTVIELSHENHPDNKKNIEDREHKLESKPPPTHLLDLQRSIILTDSPHAKTVRNEAKYANDPKKIDMVTYRNINELKATGINLKSSTTRRPRDISFSHGWFAAELTLPEIVVDDTSASTFLNLIAYEMCPDFKNDYGICTFAAFMDSLIDHPEDVKALRSAKILLNSLGSDEDVAHLFNIISTDLVPDSLKYARVRAEIEAHYRDQLKTWIAMFRHTYFSNPWAIIAFLAAIVALFLTFVQTWFAMRPPKD